MAQAAQLHTLRDPAVAPIVPELSCLSYIIQRVQAAWNAVCTWISAWVSYLTKSEYNLATRCPNAFYSTMQYLSPDEVAKCELVCKSWKMPDKVWKAQCAQEKVSYELEAGKHKEAFSNPQPPLAFGVEDWKMYLKADPGVAPRLSFRIHRMVARRCETHTLTLIPATVDGEPLSYVTFAPIAEKSGMQLRAFPQFEQIQSKPVGRSLWVWMQKHLDPASINKTYKELNEHFSQKMGRALWISVSIVAHFARDKFYLFPNMPSGGKFYTASSDIIKTPFSYNVLVGGSAPGLLEHAYDPGMFDTYGVAPCYPA